MAVADLVRSIFCSHTSLLLLYFAIGIATYDRLEGWGTLDSVYFIVVTSSTVGFGDLTPTTDAGKLFTCVYGLLGMSVVFSWISPPVQAILSGVRAALERLMPNRVNTDDETLTLAEINASISYTRRYFRAIAGPLLLVTFVCLVHRFVIVRPLVDSVYFSVMTMTTIGFGDVTPETPLGKVLAIVYLPIAVTALADAVDTIQITATRRRIREADNTGLIDELLLQKARACGGDPAETLSEAEFLVHTLTQHELIDEDTLRAVRRQFASLARTSTATAANGDARRRRHELIDSSVVHRQLLQQGKLSEAERQYTHWYEATWSRRCAGS